MWVRSSAGGRGRSSYALPLGHELVRRDQRQHGDLRWNVTAHGGTSGNLLRFYTIRRFESILWGEKFSSLLEGVYIQSILS